VSGNAIERLKERLGELLVGARLTLDVPEDTKRGVWWLDVGYHGQHVAVEWKPGHDAFGVSRVTEVTGIGEISDERLPSLEAAAQRVTKLLRP
jgi:hypothetical protein